MRSWLGPLLILLLVVGALWLLHRELAHYLGRIALASFLGYTASNNFGTLLGATTIRLRLYTAWDGGNPYSRNAVFVSPEAHANAS